MRLSPPDRAEEDPAEENSARLPSELEARTLLDQLPAILYVADAGVEGRWHYVSSAAEGILGFAPREWIEDPGLWARQVHPEDRDRVFGREDELSSPTLPEEYRLRHRDGSTVWVRDEAALVSDPHGMVRWHGVITDITDRKLAEAVLEQRAAQQAAVARLGKHALRTTDTAELIGDALEQATSILGAEIGAVIEQAEDGHELILRAGSCFPPHATADRLPDGLIAKIEGRNRTWGYVWLASRPERGFETADVDFVQALANILADAIQHRAVEQDIRHQALHDHLTGLPNRLLFLDRLGRALLRPEAEVAVLLLDVDNFKLINDSLGHSAGDELLVQIAPRLKAALRPGDVVARLGGDEFVMLLEQVPDESAAAQIAERVVDAFEVPFELQAGEHFAKASMGIALCSDATALPASLIRDADAAMYQAKARGRGSLEVFDRDMRARTVKRLAVENDLRRALERDELRVVYQPIVSLKDGSMSGLEALLRWQHPERGLINPEEFIPVAEECGLIEPIGRWALDAACSQAALWHTARPDSRPLGIAINLSVRQFTQRDLAGTVSEVLARTGIEPSSVCLEITESVLAEEAADVSKTINQLAELGVRFVLDDFGTGYSSLAYLTRLPIDGLKVDRSFVQTLGSSKRSTAITTAIVRMAQALSLEVIAEGVETTRQADALRSLQCELAQGYLFYPPLSGSTVSQLIGRAPQTSPAHVPAKAC